MTRPAIKRTRRNGTVRCAIYTRKSSEEGLEQEFNSLQAQREASSDGLYCGNVSDAHSRCRQRLLLGRGVRHRRGVMAVRVGLSLDDLYSIIAVRN
jgi:hypothetical protein